MNIGFQFLQNFILFVKKIIVKLKYFTYLRFISLLKSNFIILFAIFLLIACKNDSTTNAEETAVKDKISLIVGEWFGQNKKGEEMTWVFKEDKSFTIIKGNMVMKSTDLVEKMFMDTSVRPVHPALRGKTVTMVYETNLTPVPNHFDLVVKANDEEVLRFKGLIEFLTDNKIRLYMALDNTEDGMSVRPSGFNDEDDIVYTRK